MIRKFLSEAEVTRKAEVTRDPPHYHYIDALRGIAILGVFVVHSSQHISDIPNHLYRVCIFGQYGVQLFFVLSALTLLLSFHGRNQEKQAHVRNFYIRRFFRIAPMFWFGLVLYNYSGFHPNYWTPAGINWWQIFAAFTFMHGWYPTYINGPVPGGWSIAVETTFYVIFPLLAGWLFTRQRILITLLCALVASHLLSRFLFVGMTSSWQGSRTHVLQGFFNWWFPAQLPVFMIGFFLYYQLQGLTKSSGYVGPNRSRIALCYVFGAWLLVALLILISPYLDPFLGKSHTTSWLSSLFAVAWALLVYGLAMFPFRLFVNRFFRYLGLISFSGYIDHFFVLDKTDYLISGSMRHLHFTLSPLLHYTVFCAIALPATIAAATLTYRYIEQPGIASGKKLILHLTVR